MPVILLNPCDLIGRFVLLCRKTPRKLAIYVYAAVKTSDILPAEIIRWYCWEPTCNRRM